MGWITFTHSATPEILAMGSSYREQVDWASLSKRPGLGSPTHGKETGLKPPGLKQNKNHRRSWTSTSRAVVVNLEHACCSRLFVMESSFAITDLDSSSSAKMG